MAVVENDTQFTRSADLMGRYRLHLTSNASPGCVVEDDENRKDADQDCVKLMQQEEVILLCWIISMTLSMLASPIC